MAEYAVYLTAIASTTVVVEADSADEATDAAYDASMPTLCAQCSGWGQERGVELSDVWEVADVTGPEVTP